MKISPRSLLIPAFTILFATSLAQAAPVISYSGYEVWAAGAQLTTPYWLPNTFPAVPGQTGNNGTTKNTLPSYLSLTLQTTAVWSSSAYSDLTLDGVLTQTGHASKAVGGPGISGNLFSFTLQAGAPSSFIVSLLYGNATDTRNNVASLTLSSGTESATFVTANQPPIGTTSMAQIQSTNVWVSFLVTNAQAGDVFNVSAVSGPIPNSVDIITGGMTITAVPEPSSLALVGLAGVGLLGYMRRTRRH